MNLNFSNVESLDSYEYLSPGMYRLKPTSAKLNYSNNNTPILNVNFQCISDNKEYNGKNVKEKFFLTEKALKRFQTFFTYMYDRKLDKAFNSYEDLEKYMNTIFKHDANVDKPFIVAGSMYNGSVYSKLPFTNFAVSEDLFEEQEFEENSKFWKRYVEIQKPAEDSFAEGSNNSKNEFDDNLSDNSFGSEGNDEDIPF
jgi:hypothetical protein